MIYFSTISFDNSTVSSNSNQIVANVLQILENNVLYSLLVLLQLYLIFTRYVLYVTKKHIMPEICIFFIFD